MDKCADQTVQIEVDESILDYLAFTAVKALLEDYKNSGNDHIGPYADASNKASVPLQLLDCERRLSSIGLIS